MKTKNKVLFICKKRKSYGSGPYTQIVSSGLLNSAKFVHDMLVKNGIDSTIVEVVDNNCIDREVALYKPTHVIIEALWVVPSKFEILTKLHPNVKWIIRLHSEIPFIANEGIAMEWVFDYLKYSNVTVSVNSPRAEKDFNYILPEETLFLPNYYPVIFNLSKNSTIKCEDTINIGCFGAVRPLKNHLIQAIAAIEFANELNKNLKFHINVTRIENNGDPVLKNIRNLFLNSKHELIEHKWLDHNEFVDLISIMDMCLQVSFSETFNIVTADAVNNNVPVVVSPEVQWVSAMFKAIPTSSDDILKKMRFTWMVKNIKLQFINKVLLFLYSKKSERIWLEYFMEDNCCDCICDCETNCICGCNCSNND